MDYIPGSIVSLMCYLSYDARPDSDREPPDRPVRIDHGTAVRGLPRSGSTRQPRVSAAEAPPWGSGYVNRIP